MQTQYSNKAVPESPSNKSERKVMEIVKYSFRLPHAALLNLPEGEILPGIYHKHEKPTEQE